MKLIWKKCSCGHSSCKRSYPTNLGTFSQGSGFEPDERALLDFAFDALDERIADKTFIDRISGVTPRA